jgi:hypothetical protein
MLERGGRLRPQYADERIDLLTTQLLVGAAGIEPPVVT